MGACSQRINAGRGRKGGGEVDATHVLDYVINYGINFDKSNLFVTQIKQV